MSRGRDRFPTEDATRVMDRNPFGGPMGDDDFDVTTLLPALDDHQGPARRIPSARAAAMVRAITDAALQPPMVLPEGTRPALPPAAELAPRRAAPRRVVALLAAAMVVTAVGAATAAVWVATSKPAPATPPPPAPAPAPVKRVVKPPVDDALIIEEDGSLDEELASEEQETLDMPAEIVSAKRARERRPAERELADDAPPEDIFALANTRLKEKRWRDADALYRRVMVRYKSHNDSVVVAAVVSAGLHLERFDDPAGALRRYRRALRLLPSGALAEEARWGVAEALRVLGDADAEAEALRAFLGSHPDSANAPAARRRLSEIARLR